MKTGTTAKIPTQMDPNTPSAPLIGLTGTTANTGFSYLVPPKEQT